MDPPNDHRGCNMRSMVAFKKGYFTAIHGVGCGFLTKTTRRRTRSASGRGGTPSFDDPPGDGGPDEATGFIADTVAELARLARRHKLGLLVALLEMAQLEAEERVRLRSKRKLS